MRSNFEISLKSHKDEENLVEFLIFVTKLVNSSIKKETEQNIFHLEAKNIFENLEKRIKCHDNLIDMELALFSKTIKDWRERMGISQPSLFYFESQDKSAIREDNSHENLELLQNAEFQESKTKKNSLLKIYNFIFPWFS